MEQQTVIGIFEKGIDAQTAVQQLEHQQINPQNIDISHNPSNQQVGESPKHDSEGKISNFFSSLFGNDDEAKKYSEVARRGWVVTVHANSRQEAERAAEILDKSGAVDVDERAMQYRSDNQPSAGTMQTGNRDQSSDTTIPIIEEQMQVGKREVETGGIHLRSRIVERPVEEKLRLREEHVYVERNPVNRPASEADLQNFKEGERTIIEHAEKPIVSKEARVVEEVKLKKETTERDETVRGTVRKQDVDIDKINPKNQQGDADNLNRDKQNKK